MMKRRPKGSGSILATPEGKYRALFAFTPGHREDIDGSPFETYEAAEAALDGILTELRAAGAVRGGATLRALGKTALDRREKAGYGSVDSERDRWNAYIENHELAGLPARLVTRGDVRDLLGGLRNQKTKKPLATQTKRNVLNLLRAVFDVGVEDERIEENPLLGMKIKNIGSTEEEIRPLTWEQTQALLAVATDPAVAVKVGTGMRSGELRSLHWQDVHLDGADPHVLARYGKPGKPRKNGKVLRVPLFGVALEAFEKMPRQRTGIVFPALRGGYRAKGQIFDRDDWKAWLKAAGIERRVRPHDLRHTCATLLLNGDLGRKWTYEEVKELLGHSSVKVTERYAKVLGTLASKAAAAMRKPRKNKIGIGSAEHAAVVTKAREILQRRGSDSNRRMTVLQTQLEPNVGASLESLPILCRSYVEAVAKGDVFSHTRGLELAEAVWGALQTMHNYDSKVIVKASAIQAINE